ncbi:MAG: dihydroorotase [Clostridia bacterium]|nr:dihydroorotase [Clostridia bacterium]
MKYILKNADFFDGEKFKSGDVSVCGEAASFGVFGNSDADIIDASGLCVLPGFIDVHVHFREPGFSYKETIKTGSMAAAAGGYTDVCTMPNLKPVPDSAENLAKQEAIIKESAVVGVHPYGSITKGENGAELSDMEALAQRVVAFSDDGRGVQNDEIMLLAMKKSRELNKLIAAHCENNSLLNGGYIHDGAYAAAHGHKGISSESEFSQIARDIALIRETGAGYHVCHVSTKESVELIRKAKAEGLDITCETGPHYLLLSDKDILEDGRFKMNPPLRSEEDRMALIDGIKDGTIDMIATDHAPHSEEEKSRGLSGSAMGVVGLETAFPVLYTGLVKTGIINMSELIRLMHVSPKKRFCIDSSFNTGSFTVFDLNKKYKIDPGLFKSKGRSSPFAGLEVFGKCLMTFYKGELVWQENMM